MKRQVLVLNHFAVPQDGAGGTRHAELFSRLVKWDATILASDRNYLTRRPARHSDGLYRTVWSTPYATNGPSRVLNWATFAVTSFIAGMRLPRPTVVYASSPHLFAAASGWALARLRRASFVLEIRDLWPRVLVEMGQLEETGMLYRSLSRLASFLYRRADIVVVMSRGVERVLTSEEGVERLRLCFIPNGADPEDFEARAARDELRARYELQGFVATYAGAHGPANGLNLVLDAARQLRNEQPELRFLLIGDGVAKKTLVDRASREDLDNVEFRPPMPKSELRDLLVASDAGLHVLADFELFRYGVSPNKLFDYMAAGLPVVTNCPGEVADMVKEAGSGVVVPPTGIAEGVREVMEAPPERRVAWGEAGRAFMAGRHSRAALSTSLEGLLDRAARDQG